MCPVPAEVGRGCRTSGVGVISSEPLWFVNGGSLNDGRLSEHCLNCLTKALLRYVFI